VFFRNPANAQAGRLIEDLRPQGAWLSAERFGFAVHAKNFIVTPARQGCGISTR